MEEVKEPAWVTYEQVIAIHSRQLRRFGGAPGLRDDGLLRSAIERRTQKSVDLTEMIDPEVLGGLRVNVGDRVLDGTLRRTLQDMRRSFVATQL